MDIKPFGYVWQYYSKSTRDIINEGFVFYEDENTINNVPSEKTETIHEDFVYHNKALIDYDLYIKAMEENKKLRASLGAVHCMADRVSPLIIREECEHAIPALIELRKKFHKS